MPEEKKEKKGPQRPATRSQTYCKTHHSDAGTADISVEGNYEEDEDLQIPWMLTDIYLYSSLKNFGGYQNLII